MIGKYKLELRIIGYNLPLLAAAMTIALCFFALLFGELIDLSCLGFEIIFPFFSAIAVGEWGRTRADANYDVIAAQSKSLFRWILGRYLTVWSVCGPAALLGMAAVSVIRAEMSVGELVLTCLPTALLLSSLAALTGLLCPQEHMAALVCGLVWLASLMLRGLLRFPGVACFYLFLRFAGVRDDLWMTNKAILCLMGLALWCLIYKICTLGTNC